MAVNNGAKRTWPTFCYLPSVSKADQLVFYRINNATNALFTPVEGKHLQDLFNQLPSERYFVEDPEISPVRYDA